MVDAQQNIPVIDVFAGPGGLSEGFSSFRADDGGSFRVRLSVEADSTAWQTLSLRAFFRQFGYRGESVPDEYYEHIHDPIRLPREELLAAYPKHWQDAQQEAWKATLGEEDVEDELHERLGSLLRGRDEWVLIGGPPCQAYSLAGRSRNSGNREFTDDPRHYLYREYLKLIAHHWPAVFVMENVKGILTSKPKGERIFPCIQSDLTDPGSAVNGGTGYFYRLYSLSTRALPWALEPKHFVVKAEEYGIPQARHRVIILGVREDLIGEAEILPVLQQTEQQVAVDEVLTLPPLRSSLSRSACAPDSWENWLEVLEKAADAEWCEQLDDPVDSVIQKTVNQLYSRCRQLTCSPAGNGRMLHFRPEWFWDERLRSAANHEARSHRDDDLHRYLFAACYAHVHGRSPKLGEFPEELLPQHRNAGLAVREGGHFSDRFRVQVRGRPATTVTSHISKDGHYYIHPDPKQCRSLTVREAARIQTFPDNYFFCGPRTQQYHQVGNAVPPLLAVQIADVCWTVLRGRR
jgi:DNA (cytosine-5)-methyltransferase 1